MERKRKFFDTRSYSRLSITSMQSMDTSVASSDVVIITGLQSQFPRSSTPQPDNRNVTIDTEWSFESAAYRIFLETLRKPPTKQPVRGMKHVPEDFLTGHLVKARRNEKMLNRTLVESLNLLAAKENASSGFTLKFMSLKRAMRAFFKKYYRILVRDKCNYECCTAACECREVKSFLNKRIVGDDD